jgi:hypothetical protein
MDMERTVVDPLVEDYLRRLDSAAYPLGDDRRSELLAGIREHIEAAVESGEVHDEASLRALLDRLGDPEEIVAAARDDDAPGATPYPLGAPPPPAYRRAGIGLEITAALFLTVGSILVVIGWLVGVVLVWSSRRWTLGEKLVATLVFPGGPFAALFLAGTVAGSTSCSTASVLGEDGQWVTVSDTCAQQTGVAPWLGLLFFAAWVVLPVVVAGVLVMRARRRADAEPPVLVTPGAPTRWGGLEIAAVLLIGLGAFVLPVIGIVAGLVCAWLSDQWTRTEKWIATAIASTCLIVPLLAAVALVALRTSS